MNVASGAVLIQTALLENELIAFFDIRLSSFLRVMDISMLV